MGTRTETSRTTVVDDRLDSTTRLGRAMVDATIASRDERDLYYYHLSRHMRVTHGQEVPAGTPNRRRLTAELHDTLHDDGAGHDRMWGLE